MIWAAALGVVAAFVVLAKLFRVPGLAHAVFDQSRRAFGDLRDPALGEREKEGSIRSHARHLLLLFVFISLASIAALALPLGLVVLLDRAGLLDFDAVVQRTVSPAFLLVVTPLGIVLALLLHRRRP